MEGGGGGRLFEAGRLLTFSAFRMGAYSNKYGIILHCNGIALHYIVYVLDCIAAYGIMFQCIVLHYIYRIAFHCIALNCITLYSIVFSSIAKLMLKLKRAGSE